MIPSRHVFDELAEEYDHWFDERGAVYGAQLSMLLPAVPRSGRGLEGGVGPGRSQDRSGSIPVSILPVNS